MTIHYALTRTEIAGSFWRSLRTSPRFFATITFYALTFSAFVLFSAGALDRPWTSVSTALAIGALLGFFLLMPAMLFLRAKTSERTLTLSASGISTEIGKLKGQLPWHKIKIISETNTHVLIAGASGNAFFIPARAFPSPTQKTEFFNLARTFSSRNSAAK